MTSLIEREQASIKSPRSPGRPSSGQFSFKGSLYVAHNEKDWIEIQKNTFTNWCNVQIQPYGVQITSDLAEAFQDGLSLVYLVESISTKKVGRYNKNPRLYAQKLENITSALKLLQSDGIKLVNIGELFKLFRDSNVHTDVRDDNCSALLFTFLVLNVSIDTQTSVK